VGLSTGSAAGVFAPAVPPRPLRFFASSATAPPRLACPAQA
jgi:hypothetical protein